MTDYRAVMDLVLKGWSVPFARSPRRWDARIPSCKKFVKCCKQAAQITTTAQIAGLNDEAVAVLVDSR